MENKVIEEYFTKDLGEAAALLCKGAKMIRLQRQENFFWFVFANKELCLNLSNDYWFNSLPINAKLYQETLRSLKDRLFAQK